MAFPALALESRLRVKVVPGNVPRRQPERDQSHDQKNRLLRHGLGVYRAKRSCKEEQRLSQSQFTAISALLLMLPTACFTNLLISSEASLALSTLEAPLEKRGHERKPPSRDFHAILRNTTVRRKFA